MLNRRSISRMRPSGTSVGDLNVRSRIFGSCSESSKAGRMVRDGPTATLEATLAGWALPLPFGSKVRRDTRSQWRCSEGSTNFAPSAESLVAMDFAGLPLAASAHSLVRKLKSIDWKMSVSVRNLSVVYGHTEAPFVFQRQAEECVVLSGNERSGEILGQFWVQALSFRLAEEREDSRSLQTGLLASGN